MLISSMNSSLKNQKQNYPNFGMNKTKTIAVADRVISPKLKSFFDKMSHLRIEEEQLAKLGSEELEVLEKAALEMNASAKENDIKLVVKAKKDGSLDIQVDKPPSPPSKALIAAKQTATKVLTFPWKHKILSTIGGLALGIRACVAHEAHLSELEKALEMKILSEHGLSELVPKCKTDPDAFYEFIPTKEQRVSDEANNCYRMLIDRAVAMDAGKEVQRIAADDKAKGRTRGDVGKLMDEEYMKAFKELKVTNSEVIGGIYLELKAMFVDGVYQARNDKIKIYNLSRSIYNGGNVQKLVNGNMIFKWTPHYYNEPHYKWDKPDWYNFE